MTALVREFLTFFELDYTCSVFDPESNAVSLYYSVLVLYQHMIIIISMLVT